MAKNTKSRSPLVPPPGRLYAFCAVALAVFVLAFAIWPAERPLCYVEAEAWWLDEASDRSPQIHDAIITVTDRDNIAIMWRDYNDERIVDDLHAANPELDREQARLEAREIVGRSGQSAPLLTVTYGGSNTEFVSSVHITLADVDEIVASNVIEDVIWQVHEAIMAHAFAEATDDESAENLQTAHTRLQQARLQQAHAERQLNTFVAEHFDLIEENTAPPVADNSNEAESTATAGLNPRWAAMQEQLVHLVNQRQQLANVATTAHPQLRYLDLELERVRAALLATPQYEPGSGASRSNYPVTDGTGVVLSEPLADGLAAAAPAPTPTPAVEETTWVGDETARYESLQALWRTANDNVTAAELTAEEAEASHTTESASGEQVVFLELFEPPAVTFRSGGVPSNQRLLWQTLAAVLAGAVVAWRIRPRTSGQLIESPEQLSHVAGVPVVGLVEPDEDANHATLPFSQRFALGGVRLSEAALVAVLVAVALVALFDAPLRAQLQADPLTALCHARHLIAGHLANLGG